MLTVNGECCPGGYCADDVLGVADVDALVCRDNVLNTQRLIVENLCPADGHLSVVAAPQDVGRRVARHAALEVHGLVLEHGHVGWFLGEMRLHMHGECGRGTFTSAHHVLSNAAVLAFVRLPHVRDQQVTTIHHSQPVEKNC